MVKSYSTLNLKKKLKQRILSKIFSSKVKPISEVKNTKKSEKIKPIAIVNEIQEINSQESIKDHFFTFQLHNDLFTLLYATLIFKWIQTDRVKYNYFKTRF